MARRARRAGLYQIDQSWMKFARCKMCGFKCCINNYSDHQVRITRVRGVFVCPWCADRMKFGINLYIFVKQLADKPCKKDGCGECSRCEAKKIIEGRYADYRADRVILS